MANFFSSRYTIKVGNDYKIYLPVRFGTESNRFPRNNIPDELHDGMGWTYVCSMQVIFGPTFTENHAISNKGIATAADSMHSKTKSLVQGLKQAQAYGVGSFSNVVFSPEGIPAMNAFEAQALGREVHGPKGTRRQTDMEKLLR